MTQATLDSPPPQAAAGAARTAAAASRLRRELPLLQGAWDGPERVKRQRRVWQLWREVDDRTRQAARTWLDGRFATLCDWMDTPWDAAATWQGLALAQLEPGAAAAPVLPTAPDAVLALLAHHGLDDRHPVAAWLALRARVAAGPDGLPLAEAHALMGQALQAVEAGTATQEQGLALLFDLAVRGGDAALAVQAQAQLLALGAVPPRTVWLRWLQGDQALALREPLQGQWLQPQHLHQAAWRARLRRNLRRPELRARLQALEDSLNGLAGMAHTAQASDAATALSQAATDGPAWRALQALDGCYALAALGQLDEGTARAVIATGALAPAALAAMARALALQALEWGQLARALRHLAQVRAQVDSPEAREWLATLLATLLPANPNTSHQQPVQAQVRLAELQACLRGPSAPTEEDPEPALWFALAQAPELPTTLHAPTLAMAARGLQAGALDTRSLRKRCHLARAAALWQTLLDDPDHADEARQQLASEALKAWLPRLQEHPRPHLWTEATAPATGELLIVPACVDSRHLFAQVRGLQRGLPGHHLLHLNNPELNWYSDEVFDQACDLVRQRVLPHFAPERVTCYFGSMGGHAALKLALAFGFSAVVFNPQVDLALWAAFRRKERALLLGARRHAGLQDLPAEAWARAPLYLAFGSGTADREALSVLLALLRELPCFQVVVEKFKDPHHAGLVKRIARDGVPAFVQQASQRLAQLRQVAAPAGPHWQPVAAVDEADFWQRLDEAPATKLELLRRAGRLYVAESRHCGTG